MTAPVNQVFLSGAVTPVSSDAMNTWVQTVASVAALRNFTGTTGMQISLQGSVSPGDGGAGSFYWNATSTAADDGVSIIAPTGSTVGRWIRVIPAIIAGSTLSLTAKYGGVNNNVLKTSFTVDTPLLSGSVNPTSNLTTISASVNGQQLWVNFDSIVYAVPGGDTSGPSDVVGRYIGLQRNTDAPNVPVSGLIIGFTDNTNHSGSVSGGYQAMEIDMAMNGDGTGANNRRAILINLTRLNPAGAMPSAEVALDIQGGPGWNSLGYTKVLNLESYFHDAGIDFRFGGVMAGGTGNAIWLQTGMNLTFDTAGLHNMRWDTTAFSAAGGFHLFGNTEIDGSVYFPNSLTVGGTTTFTAGATFSGAPTTIDGNTNFRLTNQTNQAGAQTATLTNAPTTGGSGNPKLWVPILVNNVQYAFPVWGP